MTQADKGPGPLWTKLNRETAKMPWIDLLRFFAQGRVVVVDPELDLVEMAVMAADNCADEIEVRMARGEIAKVSDEQARRWLATDALLWTVVVKPWVFVQEPKPKTEQRLH